MVFKSDIRGDDYRMKARQALDAAEGSSLDQVRRRHEAAADVWAGLAAFEDRRSVTAQAAVDRLSLADERGPPGPDPGELKCAP